jgi:hypothetical protein
MYVDMRNQLLITAAEIDYVRESMRDEAWPADYYCRNPFNPL